MNIAIKILVEIVKAKQPHYLKVHPDIFKLLPTTTRPLNGGYTELGAGGVLPTSRKKFGSADGHWRQILPLHEVARMRAGSRIFLEAMKKAHPEIREVPDEFFKQLCEDLRSEPHCSLIYDALYQRRMRDLPGYSIEPECLMVWGSRVFKQSYFNIMGYGHSRTEIYRK